MEGVPISVVLHLLQGSAGRKGWCFPSETRGFKKHLSFKYPSNLVCLMLERQLQEEQGTGK